METIVETYAAGGNAMATETAGGNQAAPWECTHCTFGNTTTGQNCEMCGLPRA